MTRYFLASVGNAEAFVKQNNQLVHFFSAKTLTDSSINISVTAEEVRGGTGAQLHGQFFHNSTFGVSLTDAMFKLEYLQAQVGGVIAQGGYGLTDESLTAGAGGALTLSGTPISILQGTGAVVWYNRPGSTDYQTYEFAAGADSFTFKVPGAQEGDAYCVHYFASQADARTLFVSSDFVPSELILFLTVRAYAGDASAPETGKPIGSVTIKVPRFQLNGTTDIALAMASAATIQMSGNALAYEDTCDGGKYAEIVEFIALSPYAGYTELVADAETINAGDAPVVYAIGAKKIPLLMDNSELVFEPALEGGNIPSAQAGRTISMSFTYIDSNKQSVTIEGSIEVPAGG